MENFAYLYLADAYEAPAENYLVNPWVAAWFQGLNWRRLSSATYIRFVSLGVMLSVLSLATHAWALSRGDRGLPVTNLQQNLRSLGCFNGSITGTYDFTTEAGVRRCQLALGLPGNGVADLTTEQVFQQRLGQVRSQILIPSRTEPRLARGDTGADVEFVQRTLLSRGYFNGPVTGFYGEITEAAVRSFQVANQLPASGAIDAVTYQRLQQFQAASPAASFSVPSQGFNTVSAASQGLKRGDRNFQVRELQKRLVVWGYSNVNVDGNYGVQTETAVKQFQIGCGFVPDGIADANTQKVLDGKLYVVVVPERNNTTLIRVQQIFPTAFKANSRLGDYVHVGSDPSIDIAKTRVKVLRQNGIVDARVAYF